jgi:hypothetical protein
VRPVTIEVLFRSESGIASNACDQTMVTRSRKCCQDQESGVVTITSVSTSTVSSGLIYQLLDLCVLDRHGAEKGSSPSHLSTRSGIQSSDLRPIRVVIFETFWVESSGLASLGSETEAPAGLLS